MTKKYILNKETSRIELHFSKEEYKALQDELKRELKRFYSWSRYADAWVSKSKNNHYNAIRIAEKLGFTDGGSTGERLSFTEELERQTEKAERRAERYDQYAQNANNRAKGLQSEFNELRKDWSWVTQPIITGHSGSESFNKQRQRIIDRYEKGFDEYRKSEYFKERAEIARQTADQTKLKNRSYLSNRIEECNKNIRMYERNIVAAEENSNNSWLEKSLENMEYELDKLAFFENCLEDLGGMRYNRDNIKPGYHIKIQGKWCEVVKANPKTVEVQFSYVPYTLKYNYAEIQEMRIPEGWKEKKDTTKNPFEIGDILTRTNADGSRIIYAFQVVRTTDKNVILQAIKLKDNIPQKDNFTSDKKERRAIRQDRSGNFVVNYDDWYLYRYTQQDQQEAI